MKQKQINLAEYLKDFSTHEGWVWGRQREEMEGGKVGGEGGKGGGEYEGKGSGEYLDARL